MHIYICMYICVSIHIHTGDVHMIDLFAVRAHVRLLRSHMYIYIYICVQMCVWTYTYVCIYVYIHMNVYMCIYKHTYRCCTYDWSICGTCTRPSRQIPYIYIYIHMCIYMYITYIYVCIYVYIHMNVYMCIYKHTHRCCTYYWSICGTCTRPSPQIPPMTWTNLLRMHKYALVCVCLCVC